jgi:hypothetical protein
VQGNIRHGFVYERVPHITLGSIANNTEIDVIWDQWQAKLEPLRTALNEALGTIGRNGKFPANLILTPLPTPETQPNPSKPRRQSKKPRCRSKKPRRRRPRRRSKKPGSIAVGASKKPRRRSKKPRRRSKKPREQKASSSERKASSAEQKALPAKGWTAEQLHADWWQARIARQQEIDKSIAAKAEFEYLYDKPYDDKKKVRVAGPFTVESLSPHRVLGVDEDDELIDTLKEDAAEYGAKQTFPQMVLENLKTAGVQQAHKEDRITFTSCKPWPGALICGEGYEGYLGRGRVRAARNAAAIFIGPEFGTVQRSDLVAAAREAGDAGFDVLIACAFNYEAHTTEFNKLGRIPVLKARMNADLHMAEDLKNTGKGNLFVIFGEPDITLLTEKDGKLRVKVNGVDVFKPQTGEVISNGPDGIACWFIDTDYNEESFFVRHAYFLGANDPYSALKTTLKAEINAEAWATLNSDTSRAFDKPKQGRIAVKVINHLGDEVMKVFKVGNL